MKAILHVDFLAGPGNGMQGFARLLIDDLPFAPFVGMEFVHLVWHDARAAVRVSWNVEDEYFYVVLDHEDFDDQAHAAAQKQIYAGHGWTVDANPPGAP